MLTKFIGILLVVGGVWLFAQGWSRKDSVMGSLSETGTSLANKFDGGSRTPKHMVYMGGGVILAASGAVLLARNKRGG
jgi:hypothetical protein